MTFREKKIIDLNYCIKKAGDVFSVFLQKKTRLKVFNPYPHDLNIFLTNL